MSGFAPLSPTVLDTTIVQTGQPPNSIDPTDLQRMVDSASGLSATTIVASTTLTLAHRGTRLRYNSASAGTVTIPSNATVPFTVGTVITFFQAGVGQLTLSAPGLSLLTPTTAPVTSRAQNSHIWIIQDSIDVWVAAGDLT